MDADRRDRQVRSDHLAQRILRVLGLICLAAVSALATGAASQSTPPIALAVISSPADMVTGGDALVEITGAADTLAGDVQVLVNGGPKPSPFHADEGRKSLVGLVSGLTVGRNSIAVAVAGASARLDVTNYPTTGPVFSGAHHTPYPCGTVESGLGEPLDADCSAETKVEYFYRSTAGGRAVFRPLGDPTAVPADAARTRTSEGTIVPYVVRVESGTIDRGIYRIARLADGSGWNRRLVFGFGGGCGVHDGQGTNHASDVLVDSVLSRGFALATSTELVMEQHCNDVLTAEAVMMIKEHVIEQYGMPRWTVGLGGSGGAVAQLLIAQNRPTLLDGLLPALAFPDAITIGPSVSDCRLLLNYFARARQGWTADQQLAVQGYAPGTCAAWDKSFVDVIVTPHPDVLPAGRPLDNVGVQYGLKALNGSVITKAQFLDLNANIGGFDGDGRIRRQRTAASSEALEAVYATGRVNEGAGALTRIPIIQFRSYGDARGDIHDRARDFEVRERLRRSGTASNDVIWLYPAPSQDVRMTGLALDTMADWLNTGRKPATAVDACWDVVGTRISEAAAPGQGGLCNALYPPHSNPRLIAGAPAADDVLKCRLKPIDPKDYKVTFTPEEMLTLRLTFPDGVCDYARGAVGR